MWLSHGKLLIFKGMRANEDAWGGGGVIWVHACMSFKEITGHILDCLLLVNLSTRQMSK